MRSLNMILLAVVWLAGCSGEPAAENGDEQVVRSVKVETVGERPLSGMRRFVARIEPLNTVDLAFQTGGRIERMPVEEGSRVQQGALLAELERVDYELALRDAEAGRELAEQEHQRNERLAERDAVSRAALQRSHAELQRRRVAFDNARRDLSLTRLEAPFDALVSRQLVDPFTQMQAGTAVLRLQDVSALQVSIGVPEDLMYTLDDTDRLEAKLTLASWPERSFEVHYREYRTQPDPVAQTYELLFSLPQQDDITILPGMTGTVTVTVRDEAAMPGISVPVAALDTRRAPQMVVWVLDPDGRTVHPREVEAGTLGGDRIVIESGLEPGETIVTAGAHLLQEGMTVTPFGQTASN